MTLKHFIPLMMWIGLSLTSSAIVIDNYSASKNRMLNNDGTFIGNTAGMDLSGLGISSNGRFATLIAPDIYITALHHAAAGTVDFYANNDPSQVVTRTIDATQGQRIGGTDLYVGKLTAPVSPNIKHYRYDANNVGLSNSTVVYMSSFYSSGSKSIVIGRNRLSRFREETTGGSTGDTLWTAKSFSSDASYDTYEAQLQVGDSGSSMFVADNTGEITIIGTAWFLSSFSSATPRAASVYTYTGSYTKEIDQFVIRNSASVPEPSAVTLLSLGILSLISRRVK